MILFTAARAFQEVLFVQVCFDDLEVQAFVVIEVSPVQLVKSATVAFAKIDAKIRILVVFSLLRVVVLLVVANEAM